MLLAMLLLAVDAFAQKKQVVECGESKGTRFDSPNGNVSSDSDRAFRHFFLTLDLSSSKISLLWPAGKTSYGSAILPSYTVELEIVSSTANQLSAVDVDPNGDMVGIYSLFPKEKVIYFTQHRFQVFSGGSPNSTSMWAKCKF